MDQLLDVSYGMIASQYLNATDLYREGRYDLMGDMASVFSIQVEVCTADARNRFGGWTEMMRDGADKEGLWELIKTGLECVDIFRTACKTTAHRVPDSASPSCMSTSHGFPTT